MPVKVRFLLTEQAIDIAALAADLHDPDAGAEVTFVGKFYSGLA